MLPNYGGRLRIQLQPALSSERASQNADAESLGTPKFGALGDARSANWCRLAGWIMLGVFCNAGAGCEESPPPIFCKFHKKGWNFFDLYGMNNLNIEQSFPQGSALL